MLSRRRHNGRLRDPWHIPHRNRVKYEVRFWFKTQDPSGKKPFIWGYAGSIVCVPDPVRENLLKYKQEWISHNLGIAHKVKKVTFKFLGVDS